MKALVRDRYGPPELLRIAEVADPVVGEGRILVRVRATSVSRSDWETLTGRPAYVRLSGTGFWRPKGRILGSDFAGVVEAVGPGVTRFQPGDEVLGDTLYHGASCFAELVSVPEKAPITRKPPDLSFEDAATLPQAALLALQGLRANHPITPGDRVAIVGAGGGGGSFAIQMAKAQGAEVTGVDNEMKQQLMLDLGADHVIDHRRQRLARHGYDRILDFAGRRSVFAHRRALRKGGVYAMVGGSMPRLLQVALVGGLLTRFGAKTTRVLIARPNSEDLAELARMAAAGDLTPVIGQRCTLEEVPQALRALGEHRLPGKAAVVLE